MTGAADRDPVPLADALAAVERELGLSGAGVFRTLIERWPEVVGVDVSAHATLESIRDGIATVGVDSPAWASQLRYLAASLLERIAAIVGPGVVGEIRVRVRPD